MIATDAALRARGSARARPPCERRGPPPPPAFSLCAPDPGRLFRAVHCCSCFFVLFPLLSSSPTATRPLGGSADALSVPPSRRPVSVPIFLRVVYSPSPLAAALMARGVWWQPSAHQQTKMGESRSRSSSAPGEETLRLRRGAAADAAAAAIGGGGDGGGDRHTGESGPGGPTRRGGDGHLSTCPIVTARLSGPCTGTHTLKAQVTLIRLVVPVSPYSYTSPN